MMDAPPILKAETKNGYHFKRYPHDRATDASSETRLDRINPFRLGGEVRQAEPSYFVVRHIVYQGWWGMSSQFFCAGKIKKRHSQGGECPKKSTFSIIGRPARFALIVPQNPLGCKEILEIPAARMALF